MKTGRPKNKANQGTWQVSINLQPKPAAIMRKWLNDYPLRVKSDFVNAALEFMAEHAQNGLDANCKPIPSRDGPIKATHPAKHA